MSTSTEHASLRYRDLDIWNSSEILAALWESQADALAAVRPALPALAAASEAACVRLRRAGRLVYVGAGSSGRIAFQDGVELGPTFGWPDERLILLLAGGDAAVRDAVEGAEDDAEAGSAAIVDDSIGSEDVVVGVAASAGTPYTVACLAAARSRGSLTIAVANAHGPLLDAAEHPLLALTGAEVVAGSTRLKAGTAQKIMLNLFSTLLMTRLGRVHDGRMVDMRLSNAKLRRRAAGMVSELAGCDLAAATEALAAADANIKLAVLMARGTTRNAARALLERYDNQLRPALADRIEGGA